jgi:hypothetical protein
MIVFSLPMIINTISSLILYHYWLSTINSLYTLYYSHHPHLLSHRTQLVLLSLFISDCTTDLLCVTGESGDRCRSGKPPGSNTTSASWWSESQSHFSARQCSSQGSGQVCLSVCVYIRSMFTKHIFQEKFQRDRYRYCHSVRLSNYQTVVVLGGVGVSGLLGFRMRDSLKRVISSL